MISATNEKRIQDAVQERLEEKEKVELEAIDIICSQCFSVNCTYCKLDRFLRTREALWQ